MVYKLHKNGSYNIHTIKTDKFKTIRMEIILRNNIDPKSIAKRTFLFELLMENSKAYKTKRDLILKQESLYNAICYSVSTKLGNQVLSTICMEFLNPKYTEDDYLSEAIKLPFELIFNPNINHEEFDPKTIETIKLRMKTELASIKEDPMKYSMMNALNNMDSESISSVNILGTEEKIDEINETNLYEEYINILTHDYVDIFIIGDFDENQVIDYINDFAKFNTIKTHELGLFIDNKTRKKVKEVKDHKDNKQSQIVYILNTNSLTEYERKYSMQIYNMILGGGSLETKLYQNLRGDNSLCYSVGSIYNKYDNLLIIYTSVDKSNIEKAKTLIEKSINEMIKNVSDEEITRAISSCISSINASYDQQKRIIDNYLFNYMAELDPLEERIQKYKNVTKEEVLKVAHKITLNTIYVLKGDQNGED